MNKLSRSSAAARQVRAAIVRAINPASQAFCARPEMRRTMNRSLAV